jgi:aminotransferase
MELVERFGVAGVPGSSFYFDKKCGATQIRFCFCKNYETLALAGQKLAGLQRA